MAAESLNLLVIECSASHNWYEVFQGATVNGVRVVVEQAELQDMAVTVYENGKAVVDMRPAKQPLANTTQNRSRVFHPDFVLNRSVFRGIAGQDSRNTLFALMTAGLPAVNTLEAVYMCLERPVVFGALRQIQRRLGSKAFPLINQIYYPSHRSMVISPDMPAVLKLGHYQSGYGKFRVSTTEEFDDFRSVVATTTDYCTAERFVTWDWDLRIQKIDDSYRAFQRRSPRWKGNVGNMSVIEEVPVEPQYRKWIDAASGVFGGLDICALDLIHEAATDRLIILELNDTAIGLVHRVAAEDRAAIARLVLRRMGEACSTRDAPVREALAASASAPEAAAEALAAMVRQRDARIDSLQSELNQVRSAAKAHAPLLGDATARAPPAPTAFWLLACLVLGTVLGVIIWRVILPALRNTHVADGL